MKSIELEICTGTACYILGAAELLDIEDHIDPKIQKFLNVKGLNCFGNCKDKSFKPPYVRLDGELMSAMTLERLVDLINNKGALL